MEQGPRLAMERLSKDAFSGLRKKRSGAYIERKHRDRYPAMPRLLEVVGLTAAIGLEAVARHAGHADRLKQARKRSQPKLAGVIIAVFGPAVAALVWRRNVAKAAGLPRLANARADVEGAVAVELRI